jgi:hypothetical protein
VSNANKAKGDRWERPVLKFLQEVFGRAALRPRQEGHVDVGDVHISPFALQLKDEAKHNFSSYVNDADKQALAAGEPFGAAVVKRRRYPVGAGYVVMTLTTFRDVLVRLRRAEELLARHAPEVFHTEHLPASSESPEQIPGDSQTS